MIVRRRLIALAALAPFAAPAGAQPPAFPARPVTIIIGSSPGSATDGLARAIGLEVTKETGQSVIVDNRPGAFGGIAAQAVARAQPDGYTLFMTTNTTQAANPHLYRRLAYDPVKDFAPVALLTKGWLVLVTHPQVQARNVAELVALAKEKPGKLNYGSGSSSAQVATELFQQLTQTRLNYVPYKANPPAVVDLMAGQTDLMIVDFAVTLPQIKAGKLRALGVSSPKRSPLLPDVPAIAETLPGYELGYWNALYAPAGTPAPVVQRLNDLMRRALASAGVRHSIEQTGMEVTPSSPEELGRFQREEYERWGRIIRTAGIQPE
ncbi:Bug family tripartite tricarboxylate transporter substrate binding protein [Xylophilus sp.]|uniref:Bug family tripartite tricarboxylate transporter substrate binding protein n=1 Tax=Xylophilus sp. TaxID=2653893 RepID=UPI0013B63F4C|nr:tripartite tricarboxylate transporter substrate binding protein [Xylophilus sp.]KAF1050038.1 MAG: hypothetical protein GAK38_00062 [Xylophilus sp.]